MGKGGKGEADAEKKSRRVLFKLKHREAKQKLDPSVEQQFAGGRLLACIASRPGQCGRADGYILEGDELTFYIISSRRRRRPETPAKAAEPSAEGLVEAWAEEQK